MGTEGVDASSGADLWAGQFPSASRQILPEPTMLMGAEGDPKVWPEGLRMRWDLDRARGPLVHLVAPVLLRGVSASPLQPLPACPSAQTRLVPIWVLVSQGGRQMGWVSGIRAPQQSPRLPPCWGWHQDGFLES